MILYISPPLPTEVVTVETTREASAPLETPVILANFAHPKIPSDDYALKKVSLLCS